MSQLPVGWRIDTFANSGIKIIDGDRGKQYPNSTDLMDSGYCVFLSAKNVTKSGFKFDSVQFISEEKHNQLRKGLVKKGNIVLTTRGTVGQFGYFNDDVNFEILRINSGMVILDHYESVTIRNGKYNSDQLLKKFNFENQFFEI